MQWDDKELEECRVLVASSKEEREEGEAKSEEFGTILGWDGVECEKLGLIPGGILWWEGVVELKTQASCASPSSSSDGIILFPDFLSARVTAGLSHFDTKLLEEFLIGEIFQSELSCWGKIEGGRKRSGEVIW